jgi:hypothetical protein
MTAVPAAAQAGAGLPQVQRRVATAADEQAPNAAVRFAGNVNYEDVNPIAEGSEKSCHTNAALRSCSQSTAASSFSNSPNNFTLSLDFKPPRSNNARQG